MKNHTPNTQHTILNTIAVVLVCLILPQAQALAVSLTVTADNGSVTATPDKLDYDLGEAVELIPKPETGYCFSHWSGDIENKRLVLNLTMDTDKTITANFKTWEPPIGIPEPEFGIFENYRMYDEAVNRNPALTYTQNAEGGYYTHYVDYLHPAATDTNNPYGTTDMPRRSIPRGVPPGTVIEVHSEVPPTGPSGEVLISGEGTKERPIFIRGVGNPRTEKNVGVGFYGNSKYLIVEGMSFHGGAIRERQEGAVFDTSYIAIRNCDFRGDEDSGGFAIASYSSNKVHHVLFYNNAVHDNGIWDPNIAQGDRDVGGIGIGESSYVWILDSETYHNEDNGIYIGGAWPEDLHHIFVGRNIAHHNKETGIWTKTADDVIFSENIVYGHMPAGVWTPGGMGFQYDPKRVWFLFNRVYNNTYGINCGSANVGGREEIHYIGNIIYDIQGLALGSADHGDIYFVGNTIHNVDMGIRDADSRAGSTATIANNIFGALNDPTTGSHIRLEWGTYAANAIVTNNLFQDPMNVNTASENYIEANPLFVDTLNNDFHLQSTSPAIDAGAPSAVVQQVFDRFEELYGIDIRKDIEGTVRPQGAEWDIGAYEYTEEAPFLYGDVNGINGVTATDAALTARYAVGLITLSAEEITKADVNGEYGVTATDAALIARYAVGLIDRFPVEE